MTPTPTLTLKAQEEEAAAAREAEKEVIEGRKKALKALEIRRFEKSQETRQKIIDAAVKQVCAQLPPPPFFLSASCVISFPHFSLSLP